MPGKLHQTTIRFAADTWLKVEQRASANGVSAAQYVRDATVARIAVELAQIAAQEAQQQQPSGVSDGSLASGGEALRIDERSVGAPAVEKP